MRRKNEAGQALILAALALVVLVGSAGVAVDIGVARYEKRLQQTAADDAAIAGASNLTYGGVITAAQAASGADGFTDNGSGLVSNCGSSAPVGTICVQILNPPQDETFNGLTIAGGPHTCTNDPNCADYVEALVADVHPTYFMGILKVFTAPVIARAVATNFSGATNGSVNYNCLITLGSPSSSIEGVNLNGNPTLNAPTCGIADNGNYNTKGNALTVDAGSFGVSGSSIVKGGGGTVTCTSGQSQCPMDAVPATPDPLAGLPSPCTQGSTCTVCSSSSCTVNDPSITLSGGSCAGSGCSLVNCSGGTCTVSPGTFSSITITGSGTTPNVVFNPGTYVIDGVGGCPSAACFNETGNATITGTGVTFYFLNNSTVNIAGTPNLTLSAPSSGTYQGILMYQAPISSSCAYCDGNLGATGSSKGINWLASDQGPTLGGTSGSNYSGALYFPSDQITFQGTSSSCTGSCPGVGIGVSLVVSDAVQLSGTPDVNLNGSAGLPGGLPPGFTVGSALLVE